MAYIDELKKFAAQGDQMSQLGLALHYIETGNPDGMVMLRKLAESGFPEAQKLLSTIEKTANDNEKTKEPVKNKDELKKLAAKGDSQAQYDLAIIYQRERNLEGLPLMEEAARNGHPDAIKFLKKMESQKI